MFNFSKFNKTNNIAINEALVSTISKERKSLINYNQKINRNWKSMSPSRQEVAASIFSITFNLLNNLFDEIKNNKTIEIVNEQLLKYKNYTVEKIFDEIKILRAVFLRNTKNVFYTDKEIDYKKAKVLADFFSVNEHSIKGNTKDKIVAASWQEKLEYVKKDNNPYLNIENLSEESKRVLLNKLINNFSDIVISDDEIPILNKIKKAVKTNKKMLKSYYKIIDKFNVLITYIDVCFSYYDSLNEINSTKQNTPKRFLDMVSVIHKESRGRGELTASLINLFADPDVYEEVNNFQIVFDNYDNYLNFMIPEINKFVKMIDTHRRPNADVYAFKEPQPQSQPQNNSMEESNKNIVLKWSDYKVLVESVKKPSKDLIFLPSTYERNNIIKQKSIDLKKFIVKTKEEQSNSLSLSYSLLANVPEKNIIKNVVRSILSYLTKGAVKSVDDKMKERVNTIETKANALKNKAEFFRYQIEKQLSTVIIEIYDIMLEIFDTESKRIPGVKDPTALEAFDLLKNYSEFIIMPKKADKYLIFKETNDKIKQAMDTLTNKSKLIQDNIGESLYRKNVN